MEIGLSPRFKLVNDIEQWLLCVSISAGGWIIIVRGEPDAFLRALIQHFSRAKMKM